MGKPNKKKRRGLVKGSRNSGTCPLCPKPVYDHETYIIVSDGKERRRAHAGCVGAFNAFQALRGHPHRI